MLHAGPRRHTTYVTGFVDLHRGRLLHLALGRSGSVVETWLARRDDDWRAGIDVVALDPFRGYANGLLPQLGHAEVVLDHFHAVRLANAEVGAAWTAKELVGLANRTTADMRTPDNPIPRPAQGRGLARPGALSGPGLEAAGSGQPYCSGTVCSSPSRRSSKPSPSSRPCSRPPMKACSGSAP
jgi:hypothetical protein